MQINTLIFETLSTLNGRRSLIDHSGGDFNTPCFVAGCYTGCGGVNTLVFQQPMMISQKKTTTTTQKIKGWCSSPTLLMVRIIRLLSLQPHSMTMGLSTFKNRVGDVKSPNQDNDTSAVLCCCSILIQFRVLGQFQDDDIPLTLGLSPGAKTWRGITKAFSSSFGFFLFQASFLLL